MQPAKYNDEGIKESFNAVMSSTMTGWKISTCKRLGDDETSGGVNNRYYVPGNGLYGIPGNDPFNAVMSSTMTGLKIGTCKRLVEYETFGGIYNGNYVPEYGPYGIPDDLSACEAPDNVYNNLTDWKNGTCNGSVEYDASSGVYGTRCDITGELRRKETWQYPLPVLRELLLNAVIHKDYRDPTDIMIKIFDNHIQFTNPGSLMGGLKPEDLMKGEYIAIHRNKLLAEAFYLRGDIEKFGTGFFRIQTALKEFPEVNLSLETMNGFTQSGLKVSIPDTGQVTDQVTDQVKRLIININGIITREEIQQKLEIKSRVHLRIQFLHPGIAAGVIEMTIPDKPNSSNQKYRLTDKGKKLRDELLADKNDETNIN